MKNYIGIDNGVSRTIAIITENEYFFMETPVFKSINYQKIKENHINRVSVSILKVLLQKYKENSFILIERPMVNPSRFVATASALRALEATLIVIESLNIPYQYIDSKQWQKEFLPLNIKGSDNLKKASMEKGIQMYPLLKESIIEHKDADGLFIAEYAKRHNF